MRSQAWQVGLDIQAGFARAIAVQRRHYGWQLRQWWEHPLPPLSLRGGILHETTALSAILSNWRRTLPVKISLRICLPAHRVMQHSLPLPDARLSGAARSAFTLASGAKHFPLSVEQLVMDYRAAPMDAQNIIVTAARREEMQQWQRFLAESHLVPEVVELAPCALQLAASCAGESADKLLLHRLDEGWLWVSPHGLPFQFGVFDAQEVKDISQLAGLAKEQYRAAKLCDEEMLFSSSRVEELPLGVGAWSPFRALTQLSPPLPANPAAFALAMGLALRARDS